MDEADFELCGVPAIEKKWLADFINRLRKAINLQKIILFGSRATNEHITWSDYDVAIVSKNFTGMPPAERIARILRFWKGDRPLEPLCFTPREFKQKTTLLQEIKKGRLIYPYGQSKAQSKSRKSRWDLKLLGRGGGNYY